MDKQDKYAMRHNTCDLEIVHNIVPWFVTLTNSRAENLHR